MPFLDHLEELRWRIVWSLGAIAAGMVVGVVVTFMGNWFIDYLIGPALRYLPNGLKFTGLMDAFNIRLKAAFGIGVALALPVLLYQAWAFLAPGMYKTERRVTVAVIASGSCCLPPARSLAFYLILPMGVRWLVTLGTANLTPLITVDSYVSLMIGMVLAFGFSFQLPLIILALSALGLVDSKLLAKYRRHAAVAIVLIAELLTPDIIYTTLMLAVPLYALFELSILVTILIERRRRKAALVAAARRGIAPGQSAGSP